MACVQRSRNALKHLVGVGKSQGVMPHPLFYVSQGVRYRKLEVILTTNIDKLGKAGDTVKVAPGYFRNNLMPKLMAVPNIDKFAYLIREQHKILQPQEVEEVKEVKKTDDDGKAEYEKAAKRLDNARLVLRRLIDPVKFRARATKDEPVELRAAVTKEDLVAEIARQLCVKIEPDNLYLPTPLTTFGEYEVPLRLPKSIPLPPGKVHWTLNVKIRGR